MEKQKARISHWQIQKRSRNWCIVGEIVEHPLLTEGETVITTPLLYIDFKKETNLGIFWGILSIINFIIGFFLIILSKFGGR